LRTAALEGLKSSLAQPADEVASAEYVQGYLLWDLKFIHLTHNSGSRYSSKPIKGSKDLDDSLDSKKTLNQNNGLLGWHPEPGKISPRGKNMPQL